jgi:phage baseplate assembly protein W
VGKPWYGTTIWNYIFSPNTADTITAIENEVLRVASADPRLDVANISVYPKDDGILIELEMAVVPFNQAQLVSMFLNQETGSASRQ